MIKKKEEVTSQVLNIIQETRTIKAPSSSEANM